MSVQSSFFQKIATIISISTFGLFLLAFVSCENTEPTKRPPPDQSGPPVQTTNTPPPAPAAPPPGGPQEGTQPTSPTAPVAAPVVLVGCSSPDAEPVPKEPGIRECCKKIDPQMSACLGSACWGPGFAAKIKAHMVAGGRCAP